MSSVITFSKAMPLRMVFTQLEGLNTDNPENKLFKNLGHPYFDAGEYLQPFQKTDQVVFQFKSSFDDNELAIYNYQTGVEISAIDLDEFSKTGYSIFEAVISLSILDEGAYYLVVSGSHSDAKTYAARSEPIYVKASHPGSFVIQYANNEEFADFDYEMGADNYLRVHGQFIKPSNENENEVTRDSGGTGITISDITYEGKLLEVFKASHWMIEKINLALAHDSIEIAGLPVTPEGKLEYDFGFQSLIGSPTVDVPLKDSNIKNVHDSGSRTQRLLKVTNLQAVQTDSHNVEITFESANDGNETGFDIERATSLAGPWSVINTNASEDLDYTDSNSGMAFNNNSIYYYRVMTNGTNPSGYSEIASVLISNEFVTTWQTDNFGSTNDDQIILPLRPTGTYDFTVDWGDGTSDVITTYDQPEITHTFPSPGAYQVSISGTIVGWRFNSFQDFRKIISVDSWGDVRLGNEQGYFRGCSNLAYINDSNLDMTGTTDLTNAFNGCNNLEGFPLIDTSGVTNFDGAWGSCSNINFTSFPEIDTYSGTSFAGTWQSCVSLTSFPSLDVSSGVDFTEAWRNCEGLTSFPTLDVSSGTNFNETWEECDGLISFPTLDVSNGTNFTETWRDCSGLTSFPTLDVSSGESFSGTWRNCTSLSSFPSLDFGEMTNGSNCFNNTNIGTSSWSAILIATETNNQNDSVTFHGGNATYSAGAAATARAALIADHSWSITDGGPE